ncbi:hypothetical protein [Thaumasiovibrio subtropicus]|uniref:hypothetical protein n=1 Tax=Thaumasiovibrio subtropicus TaxID=1891207 RepID=UPI000B35ACAC|nr:hypothetical protein [Thaumasiovibrio subtropicus]
MNNVSKASNKKYQFEDIILENEGSEFSVGPNEDGVDVLTFHFDQFEGSIRFECDLTGQPQHIVLNADNYVAEKKPCLADDYEEIHCAASEKPQVSVAFQSSRWFAGFVDDQQKYKKGISFRIKAQ